MIQPPLVVVAIPSAPPLTAARRAGARRPVVPQSRGAAKMEPIAYSPAKPRTPLRRKPRPNNLCCPPRLSLLW